MSGYEVLRLHIPHCCSLCSGYRGPAGCWHHFDPSVYIGHTEQWCRHTEEPGCQQQQSTPALEETLEIRIYIISWIRTSYITIICRGVDSNVLPLKMLVTPPLSLSGVIVPPPTKKTSFVCNLPVRLRTYQKMYNDPTCFITASHYALPSITITSQMPSLVLPVTPNDSNVPLSLLPCVCRSNKIGTANN